jgi:hypothetical protein
MTRQAKIILHGNSGSGGGDRGLILVGFNQFIQIETLILWNQVTVCIAFLASLLKKDVRLSALFVRIVNVPPRLKNKSMNFLMQTPASNLRLPMFVSLPR